MATTTRVNVRFAPAYFRNESLLDTLFAACRGVGCKAHTEIHERRAWASADEVLRVFHDDPVYGGEAYSLDFHPRHLYDDRRPAQFERLRDWLGALHTPPAGSNAAYRQAQDHLLEAGR